MLWDFFCYLGLNTSAKPHNLFNTIFWEIGIVFFSSGKKISSIYSTSGKNAIRISTQISHIISIKKKNEWFKMPRENFFHARQRLRCVAKLQNHALENCFIDKKICFVFCHWKYFKLKCFFGNIFSVNSFPKHPKLQLQNLLEIQKKIPNIRKRNPSIYSLLK